jgi:hypothetical protein
VVALVLNPIFRVFIGDLNLSRFGMKRNISGKKTNLRTIYYPKTKASNVADVDPINPASFSPELATFPLF